MNREWRSGDTIELELPLVQSLESVDPMHPDTVALRAGPLVLMRILEADPAPPPVTRQNLLAARRSPDGEHSWQCRTSHGLVTLKPFMDLETENYRVYQRVVSA